ncbi:MAG: APC family permease [Planctomycetota bacterium]|nr:MAG: APC family permease [Planctomycetota bacterium]
MNGPGAEVESGPTAVSPRAAARGDGLGVFTLACLVVANMIGAGVFTSSGFAMAALQDPARVMLVWWVCGVWAICGAVAYGGLVRRLKLSGGEYLFLSRLVHPAVGFLAGWISVVAGFAAPIAVTAYGAAVYAIGSSPAARPWLTPLALLVVVMATAFHLAGLHWGAKAQNTIVVLKLVLLAAFLGWVFLLLPAEAWHGPTEPREWGRWWPDSGPAWMAVLGSMSWIALSYTGFNAAIYVAGAARDSGPRVARSMVLATVLVTVIYLSLNYVFVYGPAPGSISGQPEVAAIAAAELGGPRLALVVRLTIVLAMISSVFSLLLAGPQVYQRMADDGVMPGLFRTGANGVSRAAVLAQAALGIAALLIAGLRELMNYLGLTLSACGALTVLSLWWIHRRLPDAQPVRGWETAAMLVYLGITGGILVGSYREHPVEFAAMVGTFAAGGLVYMVWWAVHRPRAASTAGGDAGEEG